MKKILILLAAMLLPATVFAQMEIVTGSFFNVNASDRMAQGEDMGQVNMITRSIEWPTDADGNEDVALLRVFFENFPPAEIGNVTPSLSQGAIVIKSDERVADNGNHFLMVFIPSKKNMDVTFNHPIYGETRLSGKDFLKHQVYDVTLRNKKTLPVSIFSEPAGATVIFDGKEVGVTPLDLKEVTLGAHSIEMRSPNPEVADGLKQQTVEINDATASLRYDLRRSIKAVFKANPNSASLQLLQNGREITKPTVGTLDVEVPVGEYIIRGRVGTVDISIPFSISADKAFPVTIDVVPQKTITFKANRNNLPATAAVNIDGKFYGNTPFAQPLYYGKYKVEMVSEGVSKTGTLKVNDRSNAEYELKLPARQSRAYNPFNTYYHRRQWGINFAYVNKSYRLKVNGSSKGYDIWGQEKGMNGVQAGITYQPYFGYGQGLSTGVYWQGFFGNVELPDGDGSYEEHEVYIPVQYQFRLPLGENFSVALNAGIGMNIGVSNKIKIDDETFDIGYGYNDDYNIYMPKSFQLSVPLGVAVQFKALQLEAKYSIGLTDNTDMLEVPDGSDEKVSFKSNFWSVGISFLF